MRTQFKKAIGYLIGLFSNGIGAVVALATQIILARLMGVDNYGLLALTLAVTLLFIRLSDMGTLTSTHHFIAVRIGEKQEKDIWPLIINSGGLLTSVALLVTVVFYFGAPLFAEWFNSARLAQTFVLMSFFVFPLYLQKWAFMILKGLGRNVSRIHIEVTTQNILVAAATVFLWSKYETPYAVIVGYGIAYSITALLACVFVFHALKALPKANAYGLNLSLLKALIKHGLPVNISTMGQKLLSRGDTIVLGLLLNETAVGLYKAAYTLASGIKLFVAPISSYVAFHMGAAVGRKDHKKIVSYYDLSVLLSLAFTLPLYLILFTLADEILLLLYGVEFGDASLLLKILCVGFSVFICTGPMASLFNAIGRNWIRMWLVLGTGLFNILLNVILISKIGIAGAALSTSFSFVLIYVCFALFIKYSTDIDSRNKIDILPPIVVGLAFIAGYTIETASIETIILKAIITFGAGALIFTLCLGFAYRRFLLLKKENTAS